MAHHSNPLLGCRDLFAPFIRPKINVTDKTLLNAKDINSLGFRTLDHHGTITGTSIDAPLPNQQTLTLNMYFDLFTDSPALGLTISFIITLCIGSFLNVVIHRLPIMMENEWQAQLAQDAGDGTIETTFNLSKPASHCPQCQHRIRWYENIPVLSYLFLKGRCSQCKTKISARYPLVELITAIIGTYGIAHFGFNELGVSFALFSWFLISLTMIDYDRQLLPDSLTLPLLWLGLLVNSYSIFTTLHLAVFGAVAGYLLLWSIYWCFKLTTGREGMGYGDFKLLSALAAWLGVNQIPLLITLAALAAVIVGVSLILIGKQNKEHPIPFGPFLATAGIATMLWGEWLTTLYLNFF